MEERVGSNHQSERMKWRQPRLISKVHLHNGRKTRKTHTTQSELLLLMTRVLGVIAVDLSHYVKLNELMNVPA